jgi:hypothetical protein
MSIIEYLDLSRNNIYINNRYSNYNHFIQIDIADRLSISFKVLDFIDKYLNLNNDSVKIILFNCIFSYYKITNLFINNILKTRLMYKMRDDTCIVSNYNCIQSRYINIAISRLWINNEKILQKYIQYNRPLSLTSIVRQYIYEYDTNYNVNLVQEHIEFNKSMQYNKNVILVSYSSIFDSIRLFFSCIDNRDSIRDSQDEYRHVHSSLFELLECIRKNSYILFPKSLLTLLAMPICFYFKIRKNPITHYRHCKYCSQFYDYIESNIKLFYKRKYKISYSLNRKILDMCMDIQCIF